MLPLQPHHIINLFTLVDDLLPVITKPKGGRPTILSNSEMVTILLWSTFVTNHKTIKNIYQWTKNYHKNDFPVFPKYRGFVEHYHRVTPLCLLLLQQLLVYESSIIFVDSTMLQVCRLVRANSHKVAKSVAGFGKNHQGWHYGFKLHAAINHKNQLTAVVFTPANFNDTQQLPLLVNKHTNIVVGDGGYTASVMAKILWKNFKTIVISPPHPKQKKKIITDWQHFLLKLRPKIEAVFGKLKEHLNIVTSFPRSVKGYFSHYIRVLLSYQILAVF